MKAKDVLKVMAILFAGILAVIVGKRMSTEAMAVVMGVICGVVAAIPTSLLITWVATKRQQRGQERERPPVIIVGGGQVDRYLPRPQPQSQVVEGQVRQFEILGGDKDGT